MSKNFVVIGASHAGTNLVETLRRKGWPGGITLLDRLPGPPVERPPLSKLAPHPDWEQHNHLLKAREWFAENDIDFRDGVEVVAVDRDTKSVQLVGGDTIAYDQLAIASGAYPRPLPGPGADLDGVLYLRTVLDATSLQEEVGSAQKVVVVGGGYIGLEAAACLAKLDKDVSVIEFAPRLLARVATPPMSAFFEKLHRDHGVTIYTGEGTQELRGDGRVRQVVTTSGRELDCDLVLVGIGVIPETQLAEAAGLDVDNGILVNPYCQTNDPDIYALGDVARREGSPGGLRIESIHNAQFTAVKVAEHALGLDMGKEEVPWFWSEQFGYRLQSAGVATEWDDVVWRDEEKESSGSAWTFHGEHLVMVEAFHQVQAFMVGKRLMEMGKNPTKEQVADPSVALKSLLKG
ncbi:MAG: FAD-dependent oxidoreductase [Pseudomonadota bacterium]